MKWIQAYPCLPGRGGQLPLSHTSSRLGGSMGHVRDAASTWLRAPEPAAGAPQRESARRWGNGLADSAAQGAKSHFGSSPGQVRGPSPLPSLLAPAPDLFGADEEAGETRGVSHFPSTPCTGSPPPARPELEQRRGGAAERRGGLLARVQQAELSPLAPSFASGQEAELRWKGQRQEPGARSILSPSPRGGLPHTLARACAQAPQLA